MKKIISTVLALTVLLSMCACNGEVEGTETSDVSSTPIISIDPSSMLSSDSPSSDIPSNEGSKPDEILSSNEDSSQSGDTSSEPEPPTPEEEEEQARIQKALNNPGASLDYDVFLVDAPEGEEEWKLLRYNMEEEELYEEFSFSPKNATGSYTVEFTNEYVGNILKVTFEDGDNCYIDVEKNKFYNSSEFKGLSKTLSVTKRNIAVTKNGQYEVWTTSHPDHGKVYYSELNEAENLLLTVFLKNNKYTFTSYNYETKEFKNLFTISEKPEVKLLNDGWFIFELEPSSTTATDGGLYMCDVDDGVRLPIEVGDESGFEISGVHTLSFTPDADLFDNFIDRAREKSVAVSGNILWWYTKKESEHVYIYCRELTSNSRIYRRTLHYVTASEESKFFRVGDTTAIKLDKINTTPTEIKNGHKETFFFCDKIETVGSLSGYWSEALYMFPDASRIFWRNGTTWESVFLTNSVKGELIIKNKTVLNAPGLYREGNIWFIRPVYVKAEGEYYSYLYRYDTEMQKTYLVKRYSMKDGYSVDERGEYELYFGEFYDKQYIVIESGYAIDPHVWLIDFNTLEPTLEYRLTWYSEAKTIVRTNNEKLTYTDTYMEVWNNHPEYGMVRDAVFIPNTSKAVMVLDKDGYEINMPSRAMLYDYSTGELTEILYHDVCEDTIFCSILNERYVFICTTIDDSVDTFYYVDIAYIYDVETGELTKIKEGNMRHPVRVNAFCGGNDGIVFSEAVHTVLPNGNWEYDEKYYFYDFITKKLTQILTVDQINSSATYTKYGVIVKSKSDRSYYDFAGALYHTTLTKSTLISESVSAYYVCEDLGYVMYYEEQEDGSFEWKYYYF